MEKLNSSTIVKLGIVTDNIEDTVARYARLFDLKKEPVIRVPDPNAPQVHLPGTYKRYRGEEYTIRLKSALIELEPIYLEILEPYDDTPSPWLDHLRKFGTSVCFMSFYVNGFRHEIDLMGKEGYPVLFEEEKGYERYAYFETLEKLGIMIEFKEQGEKS